MTDWLAVGFAYLLTAAILFADGVHPVFAAAVAALVALALVAVLEHAFGWSP